MPKRGCEIDPGMADPAKGMEYGRGADKVPEGLLKTAKRLVLSL